MRRRASALWESRSARPPRRELLPTQKGRMAVVCVLVGIVAQYLLQALSWLWVSLLALLPGQVAQSAVVIRAQDMESGKALQAFVHRIGQ